MSTVTLTTSLSDGSLSSSIIFASPSVSGGLLVAGDVITTLTQTVAGVSDGSTVAVIRTLVITDQSQLSSALQDGITSSQSSAVSTTSSQSPSSTPTPTPSQTGSSSSGGLDSRYIALIIAIIVLTLALLGVLTWFWMRRRAKRGKRGRRNTKELQAKNAVSRKSSGRWEKAELPGRQSIFSVARAFFPTRNNSNVAKELWTDANRHELDEHGNENVSHVQEEIHELDGTNVPRPNFKRRIDQYNIPDS